MLRRPPTTLTLTSEDVANYEDRRFASQQTQIHSPITQTAMDTSSSSSSSSPPEGDDEDMRDAEDEEIETSDPFVTGVTAPRRSAREQLHNRPQSPGQARAAYLQQLRATRSQQPTATSATAPSAAAASRMQRIAGPAGLTQQPGAARTTGLGTTARATAVSRQGSTEPSAPAPAPAPGRMMTRSREERIGVAGPNTGAGTGAGAPSRRR
ncbi:hypothetical protein F4818DRAFT_72783 [Hypoxylon cercidicola]|nr:hypothetical protein F4818DRAFT_72783 [Hypoxylon cercidicola]